MAEDWTGFAQYALQKKKLPAMFPSLPSSVTIALSLTRPSLPATVFVVVDSVTPEISDTDVMVSKQLPASSHARYMAVVVPVRKRGNLNTIARSPKKRHLNAATTPATTIDKEDHMLSVSKAAGSSHLSLRAAAAQEASLQAMKTVCCVYTKDFRNLHETHDLYGGEDPGKSLGPLLFDSLYNFRCQQDLQNADHDVFIAKDKKQFCGFCRIYLRAWRK